MTALTNTLRAGGFIQSEANYARSRDEVTIAGGTGGAGSLVAGTVLGKLTATGKYVPCVETASDGSQTPVAILFDAVDATAADVLAGVIARDAEVRDADLTYDATVTAGANRDAKNALLADVGIIVRS